MRKLVRAVVALAGAAALSAFTPAAYADSGTTHATAGCLRTVGQVEQVWSPAVSGWGGHIADFYQGYDQCAHQTYAEMHFWNTRVPGSASGTNNMIYIENAQYYPSGWGGDGHGRWNTNDPWNSPGYPTWWNTDKMSIYGLPSEVFVAGFDFTYNAPDGTHHCSGQSWWRYDDGTVPVKPTWGCAY